ncbi:uncharacterized protein DAT39_001878 [Clarias magur]|uniref:Uncharacterized protein n=1 Tax=Clarias magur TaxID=1594786 RepID=A0A8J4XAX5_CLAMG|nr:uncharacterized protein DAT39_001878 [Clarias magur]
MRRKHTLNVEWYVMVGARYSGHVDDDRQMVEDGITHRYHIYRGSSRPSMSDFTGNRRHNERERWVANALRHESVQLHRRLRILGLQQRRELARVRWAQLELTRTLDRLRNHRQSIQHALTSSGTSSIRLSPLRLHEQLPMQSCCPNHIVCSSCNLRLRLADVHLRRFTPALWTMYSHPLHDACSGESAYCMPSFVEQKKLSTMNQSLRYLPFV